jgi:hypothetical protein
MCCKCLGLWIRCPGGVRMKLGWVTGSQHRLGEQFRQSNEVVGSHRKDELPTDLGQAAMAHLAQAGLSAAERGWPSRTQPKASSTRLRMRWEIHVPPQQRPCEGFGQEFIPSRSWSAFCSRACRRKAYLAARRAALRVPNIPAMPSTPPCGRKYAPAQLGPRLAVRGYQRGYAVCAPSPACARQIRAGRRALSSLPTARPSGRQLLQVAPNARPSSSWHVGGLARGCGLRVVRPSIAEQRPLWFCAT